MPEPSPPIAAPIAVTSTPGKVRRRTVYYLSGFDPRGPSPYHSLYRDEAARQARLNGLKLEVGPRQKKSPLASGWRISLAGESGPEETVTEYEFLRWDDLIRRNWPKNEATLLRTALPVYGFALFSGLLAKYLRNSWPTAFTVSYPMIALLVAVFGGLSLGFLAAFLLPPLLGLPGWTGIVTGLLTFASTLALGRWFDRKFHAYWLLRTFMFTIQWTRGRVGELDERLGEFADRILRKIHEGNDDEVLVVGHSIGSTIAVPLVAEMLLRDPRLAEHGPSIALVTLGNCIPLASYVRSARRYREQLAAVAASSAVHWFDFSARRDGACFALLDTIATSGIERPAGAPPRPVAIPARFFKMFPAESYAAVKRDVFRLHFQYLMAAELPNEYDYFAITGGPETLASRFRKESP